MGQMLALNGAAMFDPMGNGRVMRDTVFLPETVIDDQAELRDWLRKALDHTATLPAKHKAPARKPAVATKRRPASTAATKKVPGAKRPAR